MEKYYKAVIAFVALAGTTLAAVLANPELAAVLPAEWAAGLGTAATLLGTWLVWLKRNEPTVAEAEAALRRARDRANV